MCIVIIGGDMRLWVGQSFAWVSFGILHACQISGN